MWQLVLNGPGYLDVAYDLPSGDTYLGRADDNEIVLSGDTVARRHARLLCDDAGVHVEAVGTRTIVLHNDRPIRARTRLAPGDVVGVGGNRLTLREANAAAEARTEPVTKPEPFRGPGAAPRTPASPSQQERANHTVLFKRPVSRDAVLGQLQRARAFGSRAFRADERLSPEIVSLALLYQVSERLAKATSTDRFLTEVCQLVKDVAQARTVVALLQQPGGALLPAAVHHVGPALAAGEVPVSSSIVEESIGARAVLCVADAGADDRFSGKESVVLYGVTQVIAVPLLQEESVVGLLYVTRDGSGADGELERLVESLTAIGHLAATGIEQQRLRVKAAEEARVRRLLERFHAPDIVDRVVQELAGASGPRMQETGATVLFGDISGFTPLTERLPTERVVALLDDFYTRMTEIVFAHGGTVDKFIGDAIMAIFGAPYARGDDAARAVRAALAMRAAFAELMAGRPEDEQCGMSIGMNTGRMLVGTVGGDRRLEFTVVGDAVNVAARVQSKAKGGQILLTGGTLEQLGGRFSVRALGDQLVKGRKEAVAMYELGRELPPQKGG